MRYKTNNHVVSDFTGMPTGSPYRQWLQSKYNCVRENTDKWGFHFSERHLQCIWSDPNLRPPIIGTRQGEQVTVIDPGRWNLEAGPDFLDAVLLLGPERRRVQGDVEIHIHPADWHNHAHANDPHYKRVVAHVTYSPKALTPNTLPPGTVEISLRDTLATIPGFAFESIDVTAYPYAALPDSPRPCAIAIKSIGPNQKGTILESAGAHRLQMKAQRISSQLLDGSPDEVLYREICGALGYKQNTSACRELADCVPFEALSIHDTLTGYAILLGVAGLIPEKLSPRWSETTRAFVRKIWDAWWQHQAAWQPCVMPEKRWTLAGLRPHNHPIRRLAALAGFACNPITPSIQVASIKLEDPKKWRREIVKLLKPPAPLDYWHHHIALDSPQRERPIAIIGKGRLSALCSNVFLPFCAACGHDVTTLIQSLPPEQSNSIIRQTAHALFSRDHNPDIYSKSGLRQQGLIQIFHDFCLNDRSGCANCPFPESVKSFSFGYT